MGLPCSKRIITLVWCLLECLFFSGLLNGWNWMQTLLKEDGFFIEYCNTSHLLNLHVNTSLALPTKDNPLRTINANGKKMDCYYEKVLKIVPISEIDNYNTHPPVILLPPQIVPIETDPSALSSINVSDFICDEQDVHLELVISLVIIIRNLLMAPLGGLLDRYGTSRTRVIALCCKVLGSITMLFSSTSHPWVVFPAMLMLGVSGMLILLTDLQIANMFGDRRYTVMSMLVGAYFSGGIVIYFMKLSKETGIGVQTSFMFITIGIVPVLISTIAMLPKSRIPWPLPPSYGKKKHIDDDSKAKAWQRRISVGGKKRSGVPTFMRTLKDPLYITLVIWMCILSLKSFVFDLSLRTHLHRISPQTVNENMSTASTISLGSLLISPFIGLIMDYKRNLCTEPHIQQMRNILVSIVLTLVVSVCSSSALLISNVDIQVTAFFLITLERVALYATFFAILMHVHFSSEHFGKSVGLAFGLSGVCDSLHFPLSIITENKLNGNTFYVHLILLCLVLLTMSFPICVWYLCRISAITDLTSVPEPQKSVTLALMERNIDSMESAPSDSGSKVGLQVTDL